MPVMNGWQATRTLRANPETKNVPILAITAVFGREQLKTCLEAGCNGYIIEPFSVMDFERKIAELLAFPMAKV